MKLRVLLTAAAFCLSGLAGQPGPRLEWSTYFQGVPALAVDYQGNVVVCSTTSEYDDWFSQFGHPDLNGASGKCVVAKFTSDGTLLWTRFLGGESTLEPSGWVFTHGSAVAIDAQANIFVTGATTANNWISGGYNTHYQLSNGNIIENAFVAKLSPNGVVLWSTYVAGSSGGSGIAADDQGNALITGSTFGRGWPVGGLITTYPDTTLLMGFALKLSPAGGHVWSTYLGGTNGAWGNSIAADNVGNILVTGVTGSQEWAFNNAPAGSGFNTFVAKLYPNGGKGWIEFLRGDEGNSICSDRMGNIYVAGYTSAHNWLTGGFDTSFPFTIGTGYLVKLSSAGDMVWGTYAGGNVATTGAHSVSVDPYDNVAVAGVTTRLNWETGSLQNYGGSADGFIQKFTSSGLPLWSTYLGGVDEEWAAATAIDRYGFVWVAGATSSHDWMVRGLETNYHTWRPENGFLAKLQDGIYFQAASGTGLWSQLPSFPGTNITLIVLSGSRLDVDVKNATSGAVTIQPGSIVNLQTGTALRVYNSILSGGTLHIGSGAELAFGVNSSGPGLVFSEGVVTVDGVASSGDPSTTVMQSGGILNGTGTLNLTLLAEGGVTAPGHSPGILKLGADFLQGTNNTVQIEIAGRNRAEFSSLEVHGTAYLKGGLSVTLSNGFTPASGDEFPVLLCAARNGEFATLQLPPGFDVAYTEASAIVRFTGSISPRITDLVVNAGIFRFHFQSIPNQTYSIETTEAIENGRWELLRNAVGDGTFKEIIAPLDGKKRFFRLFLPVSGASMSRN